MLPLTVLLALSACPDGRCAPGPIAWRRRGDDPARVYLYVDGRQRGGYDRGRDEWRDYDPAAGVWGASRRLFPHDAAGAAPPGLLDDPGVMRHHLSGGERYSLSGSPVAADTARERLAGFADDSRQPHLTLIGPPDARRPVADDLATHPALAPWRARLRVQQYDPDHWAVAGLGFVTGGAPTIYLQAPDGRVLHRQDEYRGPERLAGVLRKADGQYRPEADPDLDVSTNPFSLPRGAWLGLAAASLLLLVRRRTR